MFIPTTKQECDNLGWNQLDIILISGDTYIDTPYNGIAIVGKILLDEGYRVGVIAQPDINSDTDITRLGEPKLYWGVSGGLVDSMVANYTATKKFRNNDDFTPAGKNDRRPDRAVMVYTNLIRRYFKNTVPIVLGGIEASLRRVTHYDFWTNKIRKSILFDSKADILVYGMAEKTIVQLSNAIKNEQDYKQIQGLCYISKEPVKEFIQLPTFEECKNDKLQYINMFHQFYNNNEPIVSKGLCQKHDSRYLIQNPPQDNMIESEIDKVYDLKYERDVHPYYKKQGTVKALQTIQFSVTTHHGCYGECNFCAISVHQGRTIRSRSKESITNEIQQFSKHKDFKGIINDVGGATANMYGYECGRKLKKGVCADISCTSATVCPVLKPDHSEQIELLSSIRKMPHVKKAFVNSGIRYDLINEDKKHGKEYLKTLVDHHISGQMKVAPEHTEDNILRLMGKPNKETLLNFKRNFEDLNKKSGKKQFLTYYLIAAHPGSQMKDMEELKRFTTSNLQINPEQVQVFIPTPSTYSTLMYYTEMDPWTRKPIFVEKDNGKKQKQKDVVTAKSEYRGYKKRST
ncbi:MAG: YgiQ family radical SAM protein [Epsilonproteobacteria bacterium]|nr:MAG: YgiQ family radical SAM protein [Campylobacterota bacterium]